MEGELHDWELLQNSDDDDYDVVTAPAAAAADDFSREEYDESETGIRSDYFSLDSNYNNNNNNRYEATSTEIKEDEFGDEQGSVQSDNPSWLDPSSQGITFENKHSPEFWSDSASDGSCSSVNKRFEEEEGLECKHEKIVGSPEFWSDSGGEMVEFGSGGVGIENDLGVSAESDGGGELGAAEETPEEETGSLSAAQVVVSGGGGVDKRGGNVWWKLPLELLKFCVFRVSPVWSVSIAAAVVGFVILKRRLYKMKHKTQRIALNVTLEDNKKVSQFMARAARLNEAFSVVKRVPVIRPSLPAAGLTPWPVMSLR